MALPALSLCAALFAGLCASADAPLVMRRVVRDGDTLLVDRIPPAWVTGIDKRRSSRKNREYRKLVYRFPRVYPLAMAAGRLQVIVDSTFATDGQNAIKKAKYINDIQKGLFHDFEGNLRSMTIPQGTLLLKLIGRETGKSPYRIIQQYKNGAAAGFWQGIAKLFENDLKVQYDPTGKDSDIEELVRLWHAGEFDGLYRSLYGEDPPRLKIPDFYR